jgi:hypothetical protein
LNWSYIDSNNKGIRVLVGDIDAPDACTTTQVKNFGLFRVWCIDQAIRSSGHRHHFVDDIETVLFLLVAWERVDSFAVSMITPAVLFMAGVLFGDPVTRSVTGHHH